MDTQISNSPPFSEYLLVWGSIYLSPFSNTNFPWCSGILQNCVEIFHQPPFVITFLI